eukprot:c22166_g1_i1 orf=417-5015(-)
MAGTARVNPRSAPILPSPNLPRDGSFSNPAMAMGTFPSIEQPRGLQEQRRQRPQHQQQQQQQQRGPGLKRGRGFRDEAAERERAARERADRVALMEREHMSTMMMMPPPNMRMASGPGGRGMALDPMSNSPAGGIHTMYKPWGRAAIDGGGNTMYGHVFDGPSGRSAIDTMYGHSLDGPSGHAHSLYRHPGHSIDGPSVHPPNAGHSIYPHPGHAFDAQAPDGGHSMYTHPGHAFDELSSGMPDVGNGRGPSGINNSLAMDVRRRTDGSASSGNHGHKVNVFAGSGSGNRLNAPPGILRMEGSSPALLGFDRKGNSELGGSPGFEHTADRGLENFSSIDMRVDFSAERRLSRLETSADWASQNSRMMSTKAEDRERKREDSVGAERRLENYVGMESPLENSVVVDKSVMSEVVVGRVDAKAGTIRPVERIASDLKRPSTTGGPAMERRSDTATQRIVDSPVESEKTVDRRLDAVSSKGDERSSSRPSVVQPASFSKSRLVELEHKDIENNRDRSREDDKQMDDVGMQELVTQYKMALAELTFNSKPIITNLTIIAGENVHAARLITSAICAHILEVPVDQKLPSLYLLDSIVKNIGNEYVKHFSARLSEVFIKSYKEVDSTLHPAMQHLFRTWRVVFNMDLLREIESKLQITVIGAATSSGAAPSSGSIKVENSSSQQPGQSIHVNPKYLEAQRQKLQQSSDSRVGDIGPSNQEKRASAESRDDLRDRDWARGGSSSRPLEGASLRDGPRNGFELSQLSPQPLVDGYGNIRGIRAPKLPPASVEPIESLDIRMDRGLARSWQNSEQGEDFTQGEGNPRVPDVNLPGFEVSKKSKYDWFHHDNHQDVTSNLLSGGRPSGLKQSMSDHSVWQRHGPPLSEASLLGSKDHLMTGNTSQLFPSPLAESKFRAVQAGQSTSVPALDFLVFPPTLSDSGRLNEPAAGPQNLIPPSSPDGVLNLGSSSPVPYVPGVKHLQKLPSSRPFTSSPLLPVPPPLEAPSLQPDLLSTEAVERQGQVQAIQAHISRQSMPLPPTQITPGNQQLLQQQAANAYQSPPAQNSMHRESVTQQPADEKLSDQQRSQAVPQIPAHLLESLQSLHHHLPPLLGGPAKASSFQIPLPQPTQLPPVVPQEKAPEFSAQKLVMLPQAPHAFANFMGKDSLGLLFNTESLDDTKNTMATYLPSGSELLPISVQAQPPLPSGPPPVLNALSGSHVFQGQLAPLAMSTSTSNIPVTSLCMAPAYASSSLMQPPLPPGPPPLAQVASSLQHPPPSVGPSSMLGNNYTSLLSSLMAHGIISAPASAPTLPQTGVAPSSPGSAASPFGNAVSTTSQTVDRGLEPSLVTSMINSSFLEFKQEALRNRDDAVISALYSAIPRQCTICGLRFKHQEEHSKHMDWHASRNRQHSSLKKVSRKWFMNVREWLNGKEGAASEFIPAFFSEEVVVKPEEEEVHAVLADENQVACFLCGEPFEDFFSEETEEWMYKGAVYMKTASDGSLQGPIVHAKCQSEAVVSNVGEEVELFDEDYPDEKRKRQRT